MIGSLCPGVCAASCTCTFQRGKQMKKSGTYSQPHGPPVAGLRSSGRAVAVSCAPSAAPLYNTFANFAGSTSSARLCSQLAERMSRPMSVKRMLAM